MWGFTRCAFKPYLQAAAAFGVLSYTLRKTGVSHSQVRWLPTRLCMLGELARSTAFQNISGHASIRGTAASRLFYTTTSEVRSVSSVVTDSKMILGDLQLGTNSTNNAAGFNDAPAKEPARVCTRFFY
jgi:hypothetical protein